MKNQDEQEIEVPLTVNFDDQHPIGIAKLRISDAELELLVNGKLTFATSFLSHISSDIATGTFTDIELLEISLVPTRDYINYLKQHGFYNDNDNTTNGIKR